MIVDGNKEWHRTSYIPTTLNPVWTLSTGSLCLIQTTLAEFFESASHMIFDVKDYDSIGEHELLGSTVVSKKEILQSAGERHEYELHQFAGKNNVMTTGNKKPILALRFKIASDEDVKFMLEYECT